MFFVLFFVLFAYGCGKDDALVEQTGSVEQPYLIKTKADLIQMRDWINNDNAKYRNKVYKLMADIDLVGEPNWIPIGANSNVAFSGIFDGNGKVIKNIKIGSDGTIVSIDLAGFFGSVSGSEIKNLGVQWTRINTSGTGGGIVGQASGSTITNCYSSGAISSSSAGGVVGYAVKCSIEKCYSTGNIIGSTGAGGIVDSSNSTISDCYSTGNISALNNAGGIAAQAEKIENCYSTGKVAATNTEGYAQAGGIVGLANTVINCHSTGNITSCNKGGGIAGEASLIINCYSSASVVVSNSNSIGSAGGVVAGNSSVINCYSIGNISTSSYWDAMAGGISAKSYNCTIKNCYSSGDVSSMSIHYSAETAGITGSGSSNLDVNSNCSLEFNLALNKSLKAVSPDGALASRIANYAKVSANNYASKSMVVKKGTSENTLSTTSSFSQVYRHGNDLTGVPVDLLNTYVTANPTYNEIPLLKWKVVTGVNNGFPIFQ